MSAITLIACLHPVSFPYSWKYTLYLLEDGLVKLAHFKNAYDQKLIAIGAHRVMSSTLPLGGPHTVPALRETRRTVPYE